ncbi:MAG TPA: translocation/assembly module TamB domain-containing protein, partial [Paracoccaceae bacterium]|nr:translocation/assembly module TamB domain-containing protein [Paracoccaceae bacterium]
IAVEASARPGAKLPAEYAQLIGEKAELVVRAAEGTEGIFQIETARFSSPALNARASGTYSTESSAADLDFRLVAEPELAAPFEDIEFAGLSLVGEMKGGGGELAATARLALDGFASPDLGVESAVLNLDIRQPPEVSANAVPTDDAPSEATPDIHAEMPRTMGIKLDGNVDGLRFAGIGPEAIGDAVIRVESRLSGDELTIESARLDSALVQLWAHGQANTSTMEFDVDYRLAAPDLAPLADAFDLNAGGALAASGQAAQKGSMLSLSTRAELTDLTSDYMAAERILLDGKVRSRGTRTRFDLTGNATALAMAGEAGETLGDAEFSAKGALRGSRLALEQFEIDSPILDATAEGNVDLESGEGRIAYDVSRLTIGAIAPAFDVDASGTVSATGVFGLAAAAESSAPRLKGEVSASDLVYAGSRIGDLALDHDVALSENPSGTLDLRLTAGPYAPAAAQIAFHMEGSRLSLDRLQAQGFGATASGNLALDLDRMAADGNLRLGVAEGPFASAEATTRIHLQDNRLRLADLRATALDLEATGDLSVNLDTMLAEGAISLARADLSELGQILGTPMAGEGEGSIRLMAEGGQQSAIIDFDLSSVSAYGVSIRAARLDGRIQDALGTARLDLTLAAESIRQANMRLETINLTATGPLSAVQITADADGKSNGKPLAFNARADANLTSAPMRITMTELALALGDDRIELLAPMTILASGGTAQVQGMEIGLPDNGRLTGDLAWYGGPLAGALQLDAPDLAFLNRAFDVPIDSGALRLAADFDMRPGRARADVTIAGRDITAASISGAGPVALDASANWNGTVLDLDARATGDFERPLSIQATLPVRATNGLPELARSGPVSAHIDWKGEIGDIWALVPMAGHVVTGHAEIDIGVSGDISRPQFTGGITLDDGVYQNLDYGVILTGVDLTTTVESAGALGVQLDAVDGAEGTVRLEGRVGFDEQGIDLTLQARRAIIIRRDDAVVRLDADLRIAEAADGELGISGRVEILEAEIRLLLDNPPSIVTLGEVRVKGQPLVAGGNGQSLPIRLNIDVVAPGRIFVRGRGLDSEWSMNLAVRGTASMPQITGDISAVRGRLDLIGRTFTLERGEVLFSGGLVIDPRIDVSLVRETSDLTGRILVTGSAFDPALSFSSTPALPEDEVLPRLLFGTSSQALSPAQGLQLALGLATLLDGGGGTLDEFRSAIGLDVLSIEEGDDGAELEVGKQVAEKVWVGTRQSLEGSGTKFAVEVDVFGNVDAYGEADTEGDTTVGVRWKKDF